MPQRNKESHVQPTLQSAHAAAERACQPVPRRVTHGVVAQVKQRQAHGRLQLGLAVRAHQVLLGPYVGVLQAQQQPVQRSMHIAIAVLCHLRSSEQAAEDTVWASLH